MADDAVVTVATAYSRVEAEVICGYLRDNGVQAVFAADDEAALNPAMQVTRTVRVLVRRQQLAEARRLLAEQLAAE